MVRASSAADAVPVEVEVEDIDGEDVDGEDLDGEDLDGEDLDLEDLELEEVDVLDMEPILADGLSGRSRPMSSAGNGG
jgi:hypothetical protein